MQTRLTTERDALLEERRWIEKLGRDLLGDASSAEDLFQETWLSTQFAPPPQAAALRAWLRVVVRNRAIQVIRGEARRTVREAQVSRPESLPGTDELVERADVQSVLMEELAALDEDCRRAVVQRYIEERTLVDIARTEGLPEHVIRARITRGLEELRRRLKARFGTDREFWAALFPTLFDSGASAGGVALAVKAGMGIAVVSTAWLLWKAASAEAPFPVRPSDLASTSTSSNLPVQESEIRDGDRLPLEPSNELLALSGTVRDEGGSAIQGALVRWIALEPEDREKTVPWPGGGYGGVRRGSLETLTGSDGAFHFDRVPATGLPNGSVLVVTHEAHAPGGLDLLEGQSTWSGILRIPLGAAEFISARVVHADGSPAEGASVVQSGHVDAHPRASLHARFLESRTATGHDGRARLVQFPGGQSLKAELGGLASRPWQGVAAREIELVLGDTCRVGGSLSLPDWSGWDPTWHGERRVVLSGLVAGTWRPLGVERDVEGSEWGPMVVPLAGVRRIRARLEGIPIVPVEKEVETPAPGSTARIDLGTEVGQGVWFEVTNLEGDPVLDARATVWWGVASKVEDAQHVESSSRANGRIYVGTFPSFPVQYRIDAKGYASVEGELPAFEDVTYAIALQPAMEVKGRCLRIGEPVEEFDILRFTSGSAFVRRQSFHDRADGSFQLDGIPPGDWSFQAVGRSWPASEPVSALLEAGTPVELRFELPSARRGFGRVVDGATGEALATAVVQALTTTGLIASGPWGEAEPVQADGSFELDAFVAGANFLRVEAPGFAPCEVKAVSDAAESLDFGDVPLHRPQELILRATAIEELDSAVVLGDLRLHDTAGALGLARFDGSGVARFHAVPPGEHFVVIQHPDLSWVRHHLTCLPGEPWEFDVAVAGENVLEVLVTDESGQAPPFSPTILVASEESARAVLRESFQSDLAPARFSGIRAHRATVFVRNGMEQVAGRAVSLLPGKITSIQIRLGEAPARVRVVDELGQAVVGAWITIRSLETGEMVTAMDTGADGWADLNGVPDRDLLVDLTHAGGWRFGVPFDGREREQELVLDASSELVLLAHDGGEALAGVETRIETPGGTALTRIRATDADGTIRYGPIGAGLYRIACRRADCWTRVVEHELAGNEEARMDVELRRLGALELILSGGDGQRRANSRVTLRCVDMGEDVADWLAQGRIEAPSGLTTDLQGKLLVAGLPHGTYEWQVGEHAGVFELTHGSTNLVEARCAR